MLTIDQEAQRNVKASFEVDNMGQRYKTTNHIYTFTSPSISVIDKNLFYLLRNSYEMSLEQRYMYRPSYLSYDKYGVVNLDYLLMYINGVMCAEEFTIPVVVVPTMSAIVEVCQMKFTIPRNSSELPSLDI
jgi:hypothetical protein